MQSKISSFFKPGSSSSSGVKSTWGPPHILADGDDDELALWVNTQHEFHTTYKRRAPNPYDNNNNNGDRRSKCNKGTVSDKLPNASSKDLSLKPETMSSNKVLNKKRSYAQFHLDFGQSDFNLRTCSICGIKYAPGDEADLKQHKTFHKNYTHGIQFKAWQNERVVHMPCTEGGRIVLVMDCDLPAQKNKVLEVIKMMEIDLGDGWIYHKLCKVYLFISSQRVAGCLVAEPIKEAFKVLSIATEGRSNGAITKDSRSNSTTLQFGDIILQREATKKVPSANTPEVLDGNRNEAIVCEEKAVCAVCGIRAIWVSPSNRRRYIASQLLDAVRRSFGMGFILDGSQLAFSPPTSAGRAFASSYIGSASFLVYKPSPPDS